MHSLISVLIPARNAAPWIAATLASVFAQTWRELEVIVVDDGSTDDTAAIVRAVGGDRVTLLRQPPLGGNAARNNAYRHSRGEYIQYLDADDLLAPQKLEFQMARLQAASKDAVASCAWASFYGSDPDDATFYPEPVWRDLVPVEWLVTSHLGGGMMPAHAWLVPRAVADRAGPWAERVMRNQDGEYFARVMLSSSRVLFAGGAQVFYRHQRRGWRQAGSRAAVDGFFWSIESIAERLFAVEYSARTRAAIATAFDRLAFDVYAENPAVAERAHRKALSLGGSEFVAPNEGVFGAVSRVVGWKIARRAQYGWRRTVSFLGLEESRLPQEKLTLVDVSVPRSPVGGHLVGEHPALLGADDQPPSPSDAR